MTAQAKDVLMYFEYQASNTYACGPRFTRLFDWIGWFKQKRIAMSTKYVNILF
jgi:hypothetical protein